MVVFRGGECEATRVHRTLRRRGGDPTIGAHAIRPPARILYFTCSAGYRHDVIPLSKTILTQLGSNSGVFEAIVTEDTAEFSTENLERYAAVMFYTTGQLPMSDAQKAALLNFVRSGRGFLGIHSATDTFYTCRTISIWSAATLMGIPGIRPLRSRWLILLSSGGFSREFVASRGRDLPNQRLRLSWIARTPAPRPKLGGPWQDRRASTIFDGRPLAWTRFYGEGRVFYTALGHEPSVWQDVRYQRILTNAILWSMRRSP